MSCVFQSQPDTAKILGPTETLRQAPCPAGLCASGSQDSGSVQDCHEPPQITERPSHILHSPTPQKHQSLAHRIEQNTSALPEANKSFWLFCQVNVCLEPPPTDTAHVYVFGSSPLPLRKCLLALVGWGSKHHRQTKG